MFLLAYFLFVVQYASKLVLHEKGSYNWKFIAEKQTYFPGAGALCDVHVSDAHVHPTGAGTHPTQ